MKYLSFSRISLFSIFLFVLSLTSVAQVSEYWVNRYNGTANSNDWSRKIAVTKQGNICVMGSTNEVSTSDDYRIIIYDPNGNIIRKFKSLEQYYEIPLDFTLDNEGFIYISGYRYASWPTYNVAETFKYDPVNDSLCWAEATSFTSIGGAVAVDLSGNVYITGDSSSAALIIKYDPSGDLIWQRSFNAVGDNSSKGIDMEVDDAGNAYVLVDANDINGVSDYVIVKYNADGDTLWTARYNNSGQPDNPVGLTLDKSGNIYVTGTTYNGVSHRTDYATVKYDNNGSEKWIAIYDGPNNYTDEVSAIAVDDSANVYVTGTSSGDYATIKYNTSGVQQWVGRYAGPGNNHGAQASSLAIDSEGSVYVTGKGTTSAGVKIGTVKYDLNGNTMWDISSSGDGMPSYATSIAVDTSGNVYVTGSVDDTTGLWADWITIKYTQSPYIITYGKDNLNKTISDLQYASDTIHVNIDSLKSVDYMISDVNIIIDEVYHTNDSDLEFYLIHQDVTDTLIFNTGADGDNFIGTTLDDSSLLSFTDGTAPFTGNYKPHSPLSVFNKLNPNGEWILKVFDNAAGNTGTLQAWKLQLHMSKPTGIKLVNSNIPGDFLLYQNYPNPFNPTTKIKYSIHYRSNVALRIFDILGNEITKFIYYEQPAGEYEIEINGIGLASGIYFYQLRAGAFVQTKKMLLIK